MTPKPVFVAGKIKQNTAKLIKALESGEYTHTRHHLEAGGGHCCLGVVCRMEKFAATDEDIPTFTFPNGEKDDSMVTDAGWWVTMFGRGVDRLTLAEMNDESDSGYAPVIAHLKRVNARRKSRP